MNCEKLAMRVAIVRTMPEPSIDAHTEGIIAGLKVVRPNWQIVEFRPVPVDRSSSSLSVRIRKNYERFWRFPRMVERQAADIFHIIEPCEAHIVYGLRKRAKPVIVTCHDLINFSYPSNLQTSVQLPIISTAFWKHSVKGMQYADHIVAVSSATAKDTTQILNIEPARISVIPNAVDAIFQPSPKTEVEAVRQKYGISPETICLLNVGAIHPRKNISNILIAIQTLQQRDLPFHLWKVGADFTDEQKKIINNQGLEKHISYLGKPDKSTLIQIYSAADMLLAPSLYEGFGMTILEAMACGTPVITSNVSAMPEVAGDAGVLVDPTNYQAIADAVCHLHKNPVYYQELVEKGLARVKSFTWERSAEKIAEIYEKILYKKQLQVVAKT